MKTNNNTDNLSLVANHYKSNNIVLLTLAQDSLDLNKTRFEEMIKELGEGNNFSGNELSEKMNVDWIALNSIFLSLFMNFEYLISELAIIVENNTNGNIKVNDIKGNGYIDQFRKYIHLIGGIESAGKSRIWDEIDIFKLVRNKLAHEGGYLNPNPKSKLEGRKEFQFLIDNKVLLAGKKGHIRIREVHFLKKFASISSNLCDMLTIEIDGLNKN